MRTNDLPEGPDLIIRSRRMLFPFENGFRYGEIAIRQGRIASVAIGCMLPPEDNRGAEILDAGGNIVSPAFFDGHMHLYQWSLSRTALDLSGAKDWKDVLSRLMAVKKGSSKNDLFERTGVLMGVDFDDTNYPSTDRPTLEDLDRTFGTVPVLIRRVCGHLMLINSAAMDVIDATARECPDGTLLDDRAILASWKVPYDKGSVRRSLKSVRREMWELGIAGGVDIVPDKMLVEMKDAYTAIGGGMRLSICVSDRESTAFKGPAQDGADWDSLGRMEISDDTSGEPEVVFEKHYMDGAIGSMTASFSKGFSKVFPENGPIFKASELRERVDAGKDLGLIPMVHAIGDRAVSEAIVALKDLNCPFRIEHAEGLRDQDMKDLGGTGGALCLQPNFQRVWGGPGGLYEKRLGASFRDINRFGSIARSKVRWCFGSDMMPPGPIFGIRGAIEHPNWRERLDKATALQGYSTFSAMHSLKGSSFIGRLKEGSMGDIIIIDDVADRVLALYMNGKRMF